MIDYKTFKKEFLNEWVNRSQAARKAAEELAMKDSTTLSDRYKEEGLVFFLDGHKVEFKAENEENPNTLYNIFSYDEAIERFGKPDEDGWRLPTKEELEALCNYPYKFDTINGRVVFDRRLSLPAAGRRNRDGYVDCVSAHGFYWSSTPSGWYNAWELYFNSGEMSVYRSSQQESKSVRLVRDVK